VLHGDAAPTPKEGQHSPFSAHVRYGETAG